MIQQKNFSDKIYTMSGISKKTIEDHLKLYGGYVNKYNEITEKLTALTTDEYAKANQVFSTVRSLKTELSFAWNGVYNHELYFSHLGGSGGMAGSTVVGQITHDFGSFEKFITDLKAAALSARGWVWTVWSPSESKLINHIGDSQNTYAFWGATPILALDTYEHAYFSDFGVNRTGYIDAFLSNIDWTTVESIFESIKK